MRAEPAQRLGGTIDQRVADRQFDRGGEIGDGLGISRLRSSDALADRGFEAGEREVTAVAALSGSRQGEAARVALFCRRLDRRAAGLGQAQELGTLVERLAGGVVERRAELAVLSNPRAHEKL